jgi:hypothetical protein
MGLGAGIHPGAFAGLALMRKAWAPPGVRHWHGATDTTSVKHIAIQQYADSSNVEWMEHVTDEEYLD